MIKKEAKWLISTIMALIMVVTMLAVPTTVMADDNAGSEQKVVYVNSDGQEIETQVSEDGFVYRNVETETYTGIEIYGYKGDAAKLTVPEKIDSVDVVSFAIDPRWPVWDEIYDQVESIELPKTIVAAHSKYMNYFNGLKSISIAEGNEYYKSVNGVLYKFNGDGCQVAAYPRAKTDKEFVMPEDMNKVYRFYEGCPVESVTLSKSIDSFSPYYFDNLANIKEIKVADGNESFEAKDGILYYTTKYSEDVYNEETLSYEEVYFTDRYLVFYPWGKTASEFTVPSDVNTIDYNAIYNNPNLKKVIVPESVNYIYEDAFENDDNLTEIEFKAVKAPETYNFDYFYGVRDLMREHEGKVNIKYPSGAEGYEKFIEWINGKDINAWDDYPYLEYEEIPLGSNVSPLDGYAYYGNAYTVYSKTENGQYSKDMPSEAGSWFAKRVVDDTEEYTGLESDPFEFKVVELSKDELPAENYYIRVPGDIYALVGEELIVSGTPRFGKTDSVWYRPQASQDDDNAWTDKIPTEPGIYDYKLVTNETTQYTGALFVASDDCCWIEIELPSRDIIVSCDNIALGDTPKPTAAFYDDEVYDDIDLSKVKFKYFQYVKEYVHEEEEWDDWDENGYYMWRKVEVAEPKELGEYCVEAFYDSDKFRIDGSEYFFIMTKTELAARLIDDIGNLKWLTESDAKQVVKARAAFDALTSEEKNELKALGEAENTDYEKTLQKAEARVAAAKADTALEVAKADYDLAESAYNKAKEKADASKTAAEKAASTPGENAVKAAQQAKIDADALLTAASNLNKAAEAVENAAKDAAEAAKNDPTKTRRDSQDAGRYIRVAEQIKQDAYFMQSDAKTAADDAQNAVDSETRKAEKAKEDGEKKAAVEAYNNKVKAAGNLKVSKLKVKAKKKRKAVVTWKVNKKATGYTIQYSLKKNMKKAKTITIKKASIKKATLKKLKKGKKYYVRIRTYTAIKNPATGKVTIKYGKWTSAKKFKAKK